MRSSKKYMQDERKNMIRINKKTKTLSFYIIIAILVGVVNVVFCDNKIVSYGIVAIQILWLAILLIQQKFAEFISMYIIFFSLCVEFSSLVGIQDLYNIKNIKLWGMNLGVWTAMSLVLIAVINVKRLGKIKKTCPMFSKFCLWFLIMNLFAIAIGAINIATNNNGINRLGNPSRLFLEEMYSFLFIPWFVICALALTHCFEHWNEYKIPLALQAVVFGVVAQIIWAVLLSDYGTYGGVSVAVHTVVGIFIPIFVLFICYGKNYFCKEMTFLVAMIGVALNLLYGGSGKLVITIVLVFLIAAVILSRNLTKKNLMILVLGFGLLSFLLPIAYVFLAYQWNGLIAWKIYQAQRLFSFGSNWLHDLPDSPKVRVSELTNGVLEFLKKPYFLVAGKGFAGSVEDWSGMLAECDTLASFTEAEWNAGIFMNLHEVASYLLVYGGYGIWYLLKYMKLAIKNYEHNIWFVFGAYWFILFFGYSFTIGIFGASVFFYSIYLYDQTEGKRHEICLAYETIDKM